MSGRDRLSSRDRENYLIKLKKEFNTIGWQHHILKFDWSPSISLRGVMKKGRWKEGNMTEASMTRSTR